MIPKAKQALVKYSHQLVIANILTTRKHEVVFVSPSDEQWIKMDQEELKNGVEIESKIVRDLIGLHKKFIAGVKH